MNCEDTPMSPGAMDAPMSPDAEPGEIMEESDEKTRGKPTKKPCSKLENRQRRQKSKEDNSLWVKLPEREKQTDKEKEAFSQMCLQIRHIRETFQLLAVRGDVNSVYRNRNVYAVLPVADLTSPALTCFDHIPACRSAVLGYTGLLIHEATHLTFSKLDTPNLPVSEPINLITAVGDILKHVERFILKDPGNLMAIDALKWVCNLAVELARLNCTRLWAQSMLNRGPDGYLEMMMMSETVRRVLMFLDTVFEKLLPIRPDDALNVLFDASRGGANFIWIWLRLANRFSGLIVENLFTVGMNNFKEFVAIVKEQDRVDRTRVAAETLTDDYNARINTLAEVFNFLTRSSDRELRDVVRKIVKQALDQDCVEGKDAHLGFVFFFKLVTCSVVTLRNIVTYCGDMASPVYFFRAMCHLRALPKNSILPNKTYHEFIKQMVGALELKGLRHIFDCIMQIAYEPSTCPDDKTNEGAYKDLKEGALIVVDEAVNVFLQIVHAHPNADYPTLTECAHGARLQMIIDAAIANPRGASTLIRYWHLLTINMGPKKGAEIIVRFIFSANERQPLAVLCSFLTTITPFVPDLMLTAYRSIPEIREQIYEEKKTAGDPTFLSDLRWLENIRQLHEWEEGAPGKDVLKFLGLNVADAVSPFLVDVCSWIIDRIEDCLEANNVKVASEMVLCFSRLLASLSPLANVKTPPILPGKARSILMGTRYAYKLCMQLGTMLMWTLQAVANQDTNSADPDMLAVFVELRTAVSNFVYLQLHHLCHVFTTWFVTSYADCCLQHAARLFGDHTELKLSAAPSTSSVDASDLEVNGCENDIDEYSFLEHIHELAAKKRTAQMAHSGVIGKGARKNNKQHSVTEDEYFRREVFLDSLRVLMLASTRDHSLTNAKGLSLLLVERLCGDALSGDYTFYEWDTEKESISRYIKVARRVQSSFVAEGILHLVAEVEPCVWFAAPVMKALMADSMIEFDASFDKLSRKPTAAMMLKVDRWLNLGLKGGIVHSKFSILAELLPLCSAHEGLLLLNEVWKCYQKKKNVLSVANAMFGAAKRGESGKLNEHIHEAEDLIVAVLQRDIGTRGHLFPLIFNVIDDIPDVQEIAEPDP